ncbi:MAG TPA: sugar ABC transporter permease [Anaerolineales bacterium]|nr:sugar ABC transporter permease [Anaerolineales bacterium]
MAKTNIIKRLYFPLTTKIRQKWQEIYKVRWPYLFISPFYILFLIFGIYPILFSFYLSFTEWKGLGPIKFVGLRNFELLFRDKVFWQSMTNGVILFFMYVPIMTFLALVLAVILNSKRVRGFRFFRTLLFIPYIMNIVAAGFTFRLLLNQKYGLVNALLGIFNIPPVPWLESVWGGRISLSLLVIWAWLGYNMVIMLAGLQTIPGELTEAALIDGASSVQAFFYVTVPLMRPVILFSVVLSTMGSFNLFSEIYNLTGGGPINATITPVILIFEQAFGNFRLGYASAMSYLYFLILFVLTLLQFRYFGRQVD